MWAKPFCNRFHIYKQININEFLKKQSSINALNQLDVYFLLHTQSYSFSSILSVSSPSHSIQGFGQMFKLEIFECSETDVKFHFLPRSKCLTSLSSLSNSLVSLLKYSRMPQTQVWGSGLLIYSIICVCVCWILDLEVRTFFNRLFMKVYFVLI